MSKISVIIPCYNSTKVLYTEVEQTIGVFREMGITDYEFVLVNDCSPHRETIEILEDLASRYPFVKVIDLAKNTGQANAQLTAMRYAEGNIIINMDDDMQTHPKNIPLLLNKLEEGYDLVMGTYPRKRHSLFRNFLSQAENIFARVVLHKPKNIHFTSFWVTRDYIRDCIIEYTHPYAFMEGLFIRATDSIASVDVEHFARQEGTSGYNLVKLIKLWSNFTNFTILPLRIAGVLGVFSGVVGVISMLVMAVRKVLNPQAIIEGYTSLLCVMLLFFGIVLFFMGVMGEYIGRIFMCINSAPQHVVKRTINVNEKETHH